jgi:uridine kinase
MIGEVIDSSKINESAANQMLAVFSELTKKDKTVIAIAGESGSGKTHMALALKAAFLAQGRKALILHMDDFYLLPPALNHQNRLIGMQNVGPQEVDLKRLQQLLSDFKTGKHQLLTPVVHYHENKIEETQQNIEDIQVLIIEGTYAFYVEQTDFHLWMSRDFEQTRALRAQRNRGAEVNDPFIEKVLEKEHQLVLAKKEKANAWIDYDFNFRYDAE